MYSERFSLPFLAGLLMRAAERRRPGLGAWTPSVRAELLQVFKDELAPVKAAFFELLADADHWAALEHALLDDGFPRYAALAEKQTALEQKDYGLWRGGDLLARLAYIAGGVALGIFLVRAPFIPIPETWDLVIVALGLGAPFVPDVQVWLKKRRFEKGLEAIVEDLRAAQDTHQLYRPLGLGPVGDAVPPSRSPEKNGEHR